MSPARALLTAAGMENEGRFTRVATAGLDVLEVHPRARREWVFAARGRIVVDGSGAGVARGMALVKPVGGAPIRFWSRPGSAFRVVFEDHAPSYAAARVHAPGLVLAEGKAPDTLFDMATRAMEKEPDAGRPISPPMTRARRYIEEHFADDFDLETLAAYAGAERCHLCRTFGRTFGLPPYRFRTHLRIARARELLGSGIECSEVAAMVGFCDQSHLSRAFKELTGATPRGYARAASPKRWLDAA